MLLVAIILLPSGENWRSPGLTWINPAAFIAGNPRDTFLHCDLGAKDTSTSSPFEQRPLDVKGTAPQYAYGKIARAEWLRRTYKEPKGWAIALKTTKYVTVILRVRAG